MENINIEFVNIQSHEHTQFNLHPGLNFILAEDNNVGKSTIFKVLLCAMQLPQVSAAEIDELVRGGESQARATFRYNGTVCTLWFHRENGKATRAFFETRINGGQPARSLGAPASLRDAFDIVTTADGKVINFNDADSVQLIVQDTPKNDEVLSKVLIDTKVDAIKENMVRLGQQIQQDYRMVKSKLDDVSTVLQTMHYNFEVDNFNSEKAMLTAACRVADTVIEPWAQLESIRVPFDAKGLACLRVALKAYEGLADITLSDAPILGAVSSSLFNQLQTMLSALEKLDIAAASIDTTEIKIRGQQIDNAKRGLQVLQVLTKAESSASVVDYSIKDLERLTAEKANVLSALAEITVKVQCPVKGEVFYSDDQCVPYRD